MSYEGYDMVLCRAGHLYEYDAHVDDNPTNYPSDKSTWRCACGEPMVWWNAIDTTNGEDEETGKCPGEIELEEAFPAVTKVCGECGHSTTLECVRYHIPEDAGHRVTP